MDMIGQAFTNRRLVSLIIHHSVATKRLSLFVILCGVCISCSSISQSNNPSIGLIATMSVATEDESSLQTLWEKPLPIPKFLFIEQFSTKLNLSPKERICLDIHQESIWEKGDNHPDELSDYIILHTQIMVDHSSIAKEDLSIAVETSLMFVVDTNGNPIGKVGLPLQYCFDNPALTAGLHILNVQTVSTSGKAFSYSWVFREHLSPIMEF